jgi:hypothetical protein
MMVHLDLKIAAKVLKANTKRKTKQGKRAN